ncbi:MAG: regulatory protein RecX [Syntrophales bacterium]
MDGGHLQEKAEKKAYRLLTLRAHSEQELSAKLRQGGFPEPVIAAVVEKCRGLGYLNDGAFARGRARELAFNRLLGDRRIALDLHGKGIPGELSRQAIAEIRAEIGEDEAVDRLLRKKACGGTTAGRDEKETARIARSLLGKGFPTALIFRKLKGLKEAQFHGDDGE